MRISPIRFFSFHEFCAATIKIRSTEGSSHTQERVHKVRTEKRSYIPSSSSSFNLDGIDVRRLLVIYSLIHLLRRGWTSESKILDRTSDYSFPSSDTPIRTCRAHRLFDHIIFLIVSIKLSSACGRVHRKCHDSTLPTTTCWNSTMSTTPAR